jgi:hypothetical protein
MWKCHMQFQEACLVATARTALEDTKVSNGSCLPVVELVEQQGDLIGNRFDIHCLWTWGLCMAVSLIPKCCLHMFVLSLRVYGPPLSRTSIACPGQLCIAQVAPRCFPVAASSILRAFSASIVSSLVS